MNIGEYCISQYIILHSQAHAIWYTARDNIHEYSCNNPIILWSSVFINEGNRRPATSRWQTLSHIVVSSTPHHEWVSNLQLIAQVFVNPTTIRPQPWQPAPIIKVINMWLRKMFCRKRIKIIYELNKWQDFTVDICLFVEYR